ncbi:unnamed protein product [Merluccius merluccius]
MEGRPQYARNRLTLSDASFLMLGTVRLAVSVADRGTGPGDWTWGLDLGVTGGPGDWTWGGPGDRGTRRPSPRTCGLAVPPRRKEKGGLESGAQCLESLSLEPGSSPPGSPPHVKDWTRPT